ncbi:methyltransferase domain-containing protein [Actinoalloteichus hymeniacidonis]|uniref:Protein-L-isoaspartate O-methyltransferase n=1 Tax=Actinoalloteichus hymeniacidonis TaxID=340345 RepID=A0AAC9HM29_9PSEU|nr:methyltransferase domain-containing protein [Actinoalloteichus hymeniacidonis]AOS61629.1 protein-L-isoaspartate carboxylmethyltransferase [Actinoalloteichus hymeniacidonis]MBB5910359.1 methyltransferase of ATP-grasp peptide maturase system [Actinoalloteichus hymeniacidonis]
MTATTSAWHESAHRLAEEMAASGILRSPAWRDAVEAVPRHVFVPRFYVQQPDGQWTETSADDDGWFAAVYRNEPLVTELATTTKGNRVTVSSSTKPGLMVRMLEALDVQDGHRVLEVGTGTGYNAALLTHRLGADRVFSVDIGASLVDAARCRLDRLGLAPTLAVANGAEGLPAHAPFDRIIATCSLPSIPWAWAEQVREGGLVLVDLKPSTHAGNLVLLTRHADRFEGRFLPQWAGFMAMRNTDRAPEATGFVGEVNASRRSSTRLEPTPWSSLVPWFLAQTRFPGEVAFGYRGATSSGPEWAVFSTPDGSWSAVGMQADENGRRETRQGGPVPLWDAFDEIHATWDALGGPAWDRLGLTVTPDERHRIWLDEPEGSVGWDLLVQ